jgi:hypothetical protein
MNDYIIIGSILMADAVAKSYEQNAGRFGESDKHPSFGKINKMLDEILELRTKNQQLVNASIEKTKLLGKLFATLRLAREYIDPHPLRSKDIDKAHVLSEINNLLIRQYKKTDLRELRS